MDQVIVFSIFLAVIAVFLALGAPTGVVLGMAAMVGFFLMGRGPATYGGTVALQTFATLTSYALGVLPAFIFMGYLAAEAGISRDLFTAAHKNVGWIPGGLGVAVSLASAGFAAVTASSTATTITMAKVALPDMRRYGYKDVLSTGVIASAGTFAIMIPPSIMLVVVAIFTYQSIGKLLLAGFIPGFITAFTYATLILVRAKVDPSIAPAGPSFPWKERIMSLRLVGPFLLLLAGLLGGIFFGIWTPTEGGAMGVLMVLLLGVITRRLNAWSKIKDSIGGTVITTGAVFITIIGAMLLSKFLAFSGLTDMVITFIIGMNLQSYQLFGVLIILYLILGMFMMGIPMMAITLPLVYPLILAQGWSPIWFAIVFVKLTEIAYVTPPLGINLYAMKTAAPDVPMSTILRGIFPFIFCDLVVLVLLYLFPEICLFLPSLMTL